MQVLIIKCEASAQPGTFQLYKTIDKAKCVKTRNDKIDAAFAFYSV